MWHNISHNRRMGVQILPFLAVMRALFCAVNRPFTAPVAQNVYRGRLTFIVRHTVMLPTLLVMAAVQVNSVSKNVGFAIGNVHVRR